MFFNYSGVLTNPDFWKYAFNSTVIALLTTALVVVFGIMAAYPLARYKFKGREQVFMIFVLGLLFPATVAIIPLFILITDLNLGNTWWGVALPQAAFALPVTVVILRPFLQRCPTSSRRRRCSTAPPASASSGGSCCPCRGRAW